MGEVKVQHFSSRGSCSVRPLFQKFEIEKAYPQGALTAEKLHNHHKTFFAGFTGFGLLYITETGPETKNFF